MTRSFTRVHADFWRLLVANPLVFLGLPLSVFLVVDLLVALATDGMGLFDALRTGARIQQISSAVIGTYLAAVITWTARAMGEGERPSLGASLKGGKIYWGSVAITSFQASWRIGLGLLALIVPGLVLLTRYAVALPATVFEDVHGRPALKASAETMRGRGFKVFGWFFLSIAIYLPLVLAATSLLITTSSDTWKVVLFEGLSSIPINAAFAALSLGAVVTYLELKQPEKLQAAIAAGPAQPTAGLAVPAPAFGGAQARTRPLPWPLFIGLGSWIGTTAAFMTLVGIGMIPAVIGSFYADRTRMAEANAFFDTAVRLDPENHEVRLRIGSALLNGEDQADKERAVAELTRAVELRPDAGEGHLLLAAAFFVNGRMDEARASLERAEALGVESADLLQILKANTEFDPEAEMQPGSGEESEEGALPLELEDF